MSNLAIRVDNAVKAYTPQPHTSLTRIDAARHGNGGSAKPPALRPTVALDHVSFEVQRGEIFGVVGPNGSGKTTLIRLLALQLAPDAGRVALFGHDGHAERPAAQRALGRFGPVSPDAGFFKKLSPVENLLYGARQFAGRPAETRRRVLAVLGRLGLTGPALYRPMEALSRGTQQKVAIARAFLAEPSVLLLDEPTTGLDPRARRDVGDFIRELRATHGVTVLLTTHDMVEAERLCDRVAVVDSGRLVALDTPAGLVQRLAPHAGATLEDVFFSLTRRPAPVEEELA